jgi:hypothetical protein
LSGVGKVRSYQPAELLLLKTRGFDVPSSALGAPLESA